MGFLFDMTIFTSNSIQSGRGHNFKRSGPPAFLIPGDISKETRDHCRPNWSTSFSTLIHCFHSSSEEWIRPRGNPYSRRSALGVKLYNQRVPRGPRNPRRRCLVLDSGTNSTYQVTCNKTCYCVYYIYTKRNTVFINSQINVMYTYI